MIQPATPRCSPAIAGSTSPYFAAETWIKPRLGIFDLSAADLIPGIVGTRNNILVEAGGIAAIRANDALAARGLDGRAIFVGDRRERRRRGHVLAPPLDAGPASPRQAAPRRGETCRPVGVRVHDQLAIALRLVLELMPARPMQIRKDALHRHKVGVRRVGHKTCQHRCSVGEIRARERCQPQESAHDCHVLRMLVTHCVLLGRAWRRALLACKFVIRGQRRIVSPRHVNVWRMSAQHIADV